MTDDGSKIRRMAWQREALSSEELASELRNLVLQELYGRLWHTTHPDRYQRILTNGAILPEPDIPDRERWGTSLGKDYYPYVRTLGGVSLFDFDQFDPDAYHERCPSSSWATFVPYRTEWGCSVWIEIDRDRVAPPQLISAFDLLAKWKAGGLGHKIMPEIEAAHLGPLPLTAFKRAFRVSKGDSQLQPLPIA